MSDAVIVAIVVAALANFGLLLKLTFTAGGVKRSIDSLIGANLPDRLTRLEERVDGLTKRVNKISGDFTPAPVTIPYRHHPK